MLLVLFIIIFDFFVMDNNTVPVCNFHSWCEYILFCENCQLWQRSFCLTEFLSFISRLIIGSYILINCTILCYSNSLSQQGLFTGWIVIEENHTLFYCVNPHLLVAWYVMVNQTCFSNMNMYACSLSVVGIPGISIL